MVKIALVSCGTEYSGIQKEIEKAALTFGAEIILPEIDLEYIDEASIDVIGGNGGNGSAPSSSVMNSLPARFFASRSPNFVMKP